MSEDVNVNVEEVVQPTETEAVQEQPTSQEPNKGSAEYNFREARRVIEQQNRKINDLEYRLNSLHQQPVQVEEDPTEDDYLTKKQAREMAEQIAAQREAQREYDTAEDRARLKFRDYDDVVTQENIDELIEDDSDLKKTLQSSPNPYLAAYKLIKKSSFYQEKVKPKKSVEAEKIVKNASKPVSSNAVQSRPLAAANEFANSSKQEREALYLEMISAASRRV